VADLITATSCGTLEGVKHILFGYKNGSFRGTDGNHLQVVDAVQAVAGAFLFSRMSVLQWDNGKRKPALSNVTVMELGELFKNFVGRSLAPVPVPEAVLISMKEMPTVQSVLQVSKLLYGHLGEEAELSTMELFLSAVFDVEIKSKVKAGSALAQFEGLLLGKTAMRAGKSWQETWCQTLDPLRLVAICEYRGSFNCQGWVHLGLSPSLCQRWSTKAQTQAATTTTRISHQAKRRTTTIWTESTLIRPRRAREEKEEVVRCWRRTYSTCAWQASEGGRGRRFVCICPAVWLAVQAGHCAHHLPPRPASPSQRSSRAAPP
jgi:hypothetical protein